MVATSAVVRGSATASGQPGYVYSVSSYRKAAVSARSTDRSRSGSASRNAARNAAARLSVAGSRASSG